MPAQSVETSTKKLMRKKRTKRSIEEPDNLKSKRIKPMAPMLRSQNKEVGIYFADFFFKNELQKNYHEEIPNPSRSKRKLKPRAKNLPVRNIKEQGEVSPMTFYSYLPTNFQCVSNKQKKHEQVIKRQLDPRTIMATPRTLKLAVNRVSTSTLLPVTRTIEPSENFLFVYMLLSICIALLVASQIMSNWYGFTCLGNWFRSIFEKFRSWFWQSTRNELLELVHPDQLSDKKEFEKILQELRGPENAAVEEYECSLKRLIENPEKPEQKKEDFRNREKELAEKLEGIGRRRKENQHDAIPTDNAPTSPDTISNFTREPCIQKDSIAYRTRSACNREQKRVNDKPNTLPPETNDVEKQEDDQLTADNFLPQQSSSFLSDYEDDFANLERISQEKLAKKLADLDRSYEEKLKTARRIRKERNEDAQEEIRSIKESQNERLRLFYHK
ncbi:hypothetical protein CAEBREN_04951 [Caenorhabditis brenneri]|uniref:Uncharacterized protein n=1 Tax=Caenorhabditis brenneri TaxID=135651 RepID=G0MA77_CAEBE|nr:hypothetical protein CAEBREN_04951 [Caenorhabditis brenneri]